MPHTVAFFVPDLAFFDPELQGVELQGGNLSVRWFMQSVVVHPGVQKLEAFIPPGLMSDAALLRKAAEGILPPEMMGKGRLSFYAYHALPDVFADGKPRIMRVTDTQVLAQERYLRDQFALGPTPISCDTHRPADNGFYGSFSRLLQAPRVPYDCVVSISHEHAHATRRLYRTMFPDVGEPPYRIEVLGRPIDVEAFKPVDPAAQLAARKFLGWPEEGTITLFLGRVTPAGKAELAPLVRAFADASGPKDHLVIAGSEGKPPTFERLKDVARECGIGDRLHIHGAVRASLRSLCFAAADLYALPGDMIQEAFGNTVMEAMATGLPVIASDRDGYRDQVEDGVNGYLIPTYWTPGLDRVEAMSPISPTVLDFLLVGQTVIVDRVVLTDRLRALLHSRDLRDQMGLMARRRAMENEKSLMMDRLCALWDEQASMALAESPEEAAIRRAGARKLGLPTPYREIYGGCSTGVLNDDSLIVISKYGQRIVDGSTKMSFYEDALAVGRLDVLQDLMRSAAKWGSKPCRLGDLVDEVSRSCGVGRDLAYYCSGLLLKVDAFELTSP